MSSISHIFYVQVDFFINFTTASLPWSRRVAKGGRAHRHVFPHGGIVGFKVVTTGCEQVLIWASSQPPVSIACDADQSSLLLYKTGVLAASCRAKLDHVCR